MTAPTPPPPPTATPATTRSRARWFGTCFGIAVLVVILIGLGIYKFFSAVNQLTTGSSNDITETTIEGSGAGKIAVINLHGVIQTDLASAPGSVSSQTVIDMLKKAKDDTSVKAIMLDIDSPGGSVVASRQIYEALKTVGKPTLAYYSGEVAASGGLYVSMGANTIVSYPETLTGSIGVIAEFYDLSGLLDKVGVKSTVIKSGELKDIGSINRPMTTKEQALLQGLINDSYNRFLQVVADNRKLSVETVRGFADGRVYTGQAAKDLGMVDAVGNRDDAIKLLKDQNHLGEVEVVQYDTSTNGLASLLDFVRGQSSSLDVVRVINDQQRSSILKLQYRMN